MCLIVKYWFIICVGLLENIADDVVINNGMVQPGGGPSLNTSLKFAGKISRGRGAFTLNKIPNGLGLLQKGSKGALCDTSIKAYVRRRICRFVKINNSY